MGCAAPAHGPASGSRSHGVAVPVSSARCDVEDSGVHRGDTGWPPGPGGKGEAASAFHWAGTGRGTGWGLWADTMVSSAAPAPPTFQVAPGRPHRQHVETRLPEGTAGPAPRPRCCCVRQPRNCPAREMVSGSPVPGHHVLGCSATQHGPPVPTLLSKTGRHAAPQASDARRTPPGPESCHMASPRPLVTSFDPPSGGSLPQCLQQPGLGRPGRSQEPPPRLHVGAGGPNLAPSAPLPPPDTTPTLQDPACGAAGVPCAC